MEAGSETPSLFTVLHEKKANVGAAMMGSAHVYDLNLVKCRNIVIFFRFLRSCGIVLNFHFRKAAFFAIYRKIKCLVGPIAKTFIPPFMSLG